jgi:transglutaminase-like putative cysteine protease
MNEGSLPRRLSGPPLALALALWGWQAGLLPWALGMAAILGVARFSRARIEIGQADFNRLWNLTTLFFLGVALYVFIAREGFSSVGEIVGTGSPAGRLEGMRQISQTAIVFLRWLPFVLFPFTVAHAWSHAQSLPWSTFSLYAQARARSPGAEPPAWARRTIHPSYLYLALVLFSSCAGTDHPEAYLPLFLGLVAWTLWPWRSPRFPTPVWIASMLVLAAAAFATQRGLEGLRELWQTLENRIMQRAAEGRFDQLKNHTAIGAVGRLKRSTRIVLRIRSLDGSAPDLLREAAFDRFRANIWTATHREFETVDPAVDGNLYRLATGPRRGQFLTIARYTAQGEAPLALPTDALSLRDLAASAVETNALGAARLRGGPPLALYTVEHGEGGGFDSPPGPEDTDLAPLGPLDREAIDEVAQRLGLTPKLAPELAASRIREYFAKDFEYSLWQPQKPAGTNATALTTFLRQTHAGHCEFYATATVLLLRAAGVPARYAVGFSPHDRWGDEWLARGRDAHAWCLAHLGGKWVNVDNTPGGWREHETARASWWEKPWDWCSQAWYRFALWRQRGGNWRILVFAAGVLVLAWLGGRQLRGSQWRRTRGAAHEKDQTGQEPPFDSEFLEVVRSLERLHGQRWPHETLAAWVRRHALDQAAPGTVLVEAMHLHYRLRYDPRGLPESERRRLRTLAARLRPQIR